MKKLLLAIALAASLPLQSADVSGSAKAFVTHKDANAIGRSDTNLDTAIRLDVKGNPAEGLAGEASYEIKPLFRRNTTATASPISSASQRQYRIFDFDSDIVTSDKDVFIKQNLDRLSITSSSSASDVTIGRQPISFGVARSINPTDIITPYAFDTLDQEHRIGVDAIRVIVSRGDLSEVDMGIIAGNNLSMKENPFFVKHRWNTSGNDYTTTAILFKKNVLVGFNIQSSLGDAGTWLEAAYTVARNRKPGILRSDYFRTSLGIDYSFSEDLYLYTEYHYNSAGTNDAKEYLTNIYRTAYDHGSVYLLGKHYIIPGITYTITPLLTLNASFFTNVVDPSAYLTMRTEYNIATNTYFDTGISAAIGHPTSEFSYYSDIFYIALRQYF